MKAAIYQIERALKDLYRLDSALSVESFLLSRPLPTKGSDNPPAALYIADDSEAEDTLNLGVYLNPEIRKTLRDFSSWSNVWSGSQRAAFGVAAEEISHFHYLVHHAPQGRSVSHLELELQGEIDRFLLTYFASTQDFSGLFQAFFENFRWLETLSVEQRERYELAHRLAKGFLLKNAPLIQNPRSREAFFKRVREFYRLGMEAKISQAIR